MKVVFISNYINIHQVSFTDALQRELGSDFVSVATKPSNYDRAPGFFDVLNRDYILEVHSDKDKKLQAKKLITEADVALWGAASYEFVKERINQGKLTFRVSERYFKRNDGLVNEVRNVISGLKNIVPLAVKKNLFFLCASAYFSHDLHRFGVSSNRCYKWGYFRSVIPVDVQDNLARKKPNSILWVGRMLELKHPEMIIHLADYLRKSQKPFEIKVVGLGEYYTFVERMITDYHLQDSVFLLGSKTADEVRKLMNESQIFVTTSDFKEGWGVVVNEALNACCAVVASHAMGSVPYLINDGHNGFIFRNGDQNDLNQKVVKLLDNPELSRQFGETAYNTMNELWNPQVASARLLELIESVSNGECFTKYQEGPCSPAPIIKNNWF